MLVALDVDYGEMEGECSLTKLGTGAEYVEAAVCRVLSRALGRSETL